MGMLKTCGCKPRNVVVTKRNYNTSAFNGYRCTSSDYSTVRCLTCGQFYRSNAQWVDSAPDAKGDDETRNIDREVLHVSRPSHPDGAVNAAAVILNSSNPETEDKNVQADEPIDMVKLAEQAATGGKGLPDPNPATVPAYDVYTDSDGTIVDLQPVDSSQMRSIGYNPGAQRLLVRFKSGSIYAYDNVAPATWVNFRDADSKGKYFAASIKCFPDLYPFTKLCDPDGQNKKASK